MLDHSAANYALANAMRTSGNELGAARIIARQTSEIAASLMGLSQAVRGTAGLGAGALRQAGVTDWNIGLARRQPGVLYSNPLPFGLEKIGSTGTTGLSADQVAALNRLGVNPEAHANFAAGKVTQFQYPTAGGDDVYGFLQYQGGSLTSQLFSIKNTAGGGPAAFRTFVSSSNDLAASLGLDSLELQGGSVLNPSIAHGLLSRGFIPKTVDVPDFLGGGTQDVLFKVVPVKVKGG